MNRKLIDTWYAEPVALAERMLDDLYAYSAQHVWVYGRLVPEPTLTASLLFSAVHKNQLALFGCLELLRSGMIGNARLTLRQVFEAQLIAKFASASPDAEITTRWLSGKAINVGRFIIPRITRPDPQPLADFWGVLNPFVHASTMSQQVSLHAESNAEEIGFDLMLLTLLLDMQHHLVTRLAFGRSERYYARRYDIEKKLPVYQLSMKSVLRTAASNYSREGKSLVRAYRASWSLS